MKLIKSSDPILTAKNLIHTIDNPLFPLDIGKISCELGIQDIKEVDTDKFEGMLVALKDKNTGFINISRKIREISRKRFTIAHELGHFLITTHSNEYRCNYNDLNNYYDKTHPQEIEANQFAAELLMPKKYFLKKILKEEPSYQLFQDLTSNFGSSLTSTLIRFKDLTDESIAIVLSENSIIKWALRSEEFKYFIENKVGLSQETYAFEYFEGNDLPQEFDEVEKDAWFDTSDIHHKIIVKELSIPLRYYNQVLSVVWLYEDEDEIEDYEDEFNGYLKLKEK